VIAIVDAGPLYAATDFDDKAHDRCRAVLQRSDFQLVIPALVVTEVTYLVGRRLGSQAEATFLRGLGGFDVEAPAPDDWARMAELVEQYASFPLGGVDASVVATAERLKTDVIITLDQRHFAQIRPKHRRSFRILPE
jgi:predicted nucleic acid-binding protein